MSKLTVLDGMGWRLSDNRLELEAYMRWLREAITLKIRDLSRIKKVVDIEPCT